MLDISNLVSKLCTKNKTSDPFVLADALGITVYYHDLSPLRGYYYCESRIKYIVLDYNLEYNMRRFVLSHELGHALMHPNYNTPFLQGTLFSKNKFEVQANTFAIKLLISDMDLMEHWEYTVDQWAAVYGLPREIIELRMR